MRTLATLILVAMASLSLATPRPSRPKLVLNTETIALPARGVREDVGVGCALWQDSTHKLICFTHALPSVVEEAEKRGWVAREWLIKPDPVTDLEPLFMPPIPWRPVGTFVAIGEKEWRSLPGDGDKGRLELVLGLLLPNVPERPILADNFAGR